MAIARAGGGTSDEGMEGEFAEGTEDGGDMAVGVAAQDGEQFVGGAESDTAAQTIDDVSGALGDDGAFLDFAVLAEGLTEEDGRGRTVSVHGHSLRDIVWY